MRFRLLYVAPTLLILSAAAWPLISGSGTLYIRDVLTSHYPMKASQAEALRRGELPLIDPYRAGGQPLLGNPNALPLYPDNLLFLVAPTLWALNAHFWLHWLLAPLACYWLCRAWGLNRPAAWAGGVCYAGSGFFLSLLNLYNLVAGAALAPAFVAACLDAWHGRRRGLAMTAAGVLWGLLLLAGDPLFAVLALSLAVGAVAAQPRPPGSRTSPATTLAAALACGTLLAAPMLIELLRILPLSFRGYWQFSIGAALAQSWDPRSTIEWLLPFFFGRPDFTFWGLRFYGGNPPLFYSLYPGLLSLALVALAGRPRDRAAWWAWGAVAGGLFFATGAWNPAVRLLYHLPGASVLRFPVKLWLLVAVGGSVLCALGFERLLAGGQRRMARILGMMAIVYLVAWGVLLRLPPALAAALRALDPERLNEASLAREVSRWSALCLLSVLTLGLLGLALATARRRPRFAGALLLAIHLASQCFFLSALYDADDTGFYTRPPELLAAIPEDATVVHGAHHDLFGKVSFAPLAVFPDARFFWLARLQAAELHPFAGIAHGRRYELNHSPEGLDSFFSVSLARAIQRLDDAARVRLLAASGVDTLILDRELDPAAAALVSLRTTVLRNRDSPHDVHVYELQGAAPVQLAGTVLRAPQMNRALELLTSPSFDPHTMVVLPGAGLPGDGLETRGTAGRVEVRHDAVEELEVDVESAAGGVLLTQRAFLDLYRATIDGEAAPPVVANLHHLGVEVPPGKHRVRLWVDRRPTRLGFLAALVGAVGLAWIATRPSGAAEVGTKR